MFARTQRLTLRPAWAEDAPALAAAIAHEDVAIKLERVPWPYGLADAESFIATRLPQGEAFRLILAHDDGDTPRLVGGMGIHRDGEGHQIGYWLTPDAWGRGYATEAGRAMLGMARHAMGLRRLTARHFIDNPASGHVLRKLGFVATGAFEERRSVARAGAVVCPIYSLDLDAEMSRPPRLAA